MEIPQIWLYLIAIIVLLVIAFVLYKVFKIISKKELLKFIDVIIAQDEKLIPTLPPEDAVKVKLKNEALRVLKMAIEEGWIALEAERAMLQALGLKNR